MQILVTGGAGYIGSTICSALLDHGYTPIILDSLVTGNESFIRKIPFFMGDIADKEVLRTIKNRYPELKSVIHCAARIIVSESMADPYLYYRENVVKSLELIRNCNDFGIDKFLFSSSASVYDTDNKISVDEASACNPQSPYASTKLFVERILADFCKTVGMTGLSLRYFNPIGADPNFRTGPFVKDPTHLLGRLIAAGKTDGSFKIFADDWPTRDGSAIRDFIHVWDLAMAHVKGIEFLSSGKIQSGSHEIFNVGTGRGTTVKEFVEIFVKVSNQKILASVVQRRPGDNAGVFAVTEKANSLLQWKAERTIESGIADSLKWLER